MTLPNFSSGLTNYYQAHVSSVDDSAVVVLTVPIDALLMSHRIALVKIDAEGHEAFVLGGMQRLLSQHQPVLIVETWSQDVIQRLSGLGYKPVRLPDSPNILFTPPR